MELVIRIVDKEPGCMRAKSLQSCLTLCDPVDCSLLGSLILCVCHIFPSGNLMPKTQSLCTGAEVNLGDRVLGGVGKNNCIALPGKRDTVGSSPSKLCVLTWGDL